MASGGGAFVIGIIWVLSFTSSDTATPELTYLSRYFNTCEINATFYRHFDPEMEEMVRCG